MIPDAARKYVYYEEPDIVLLHGDCLEIMPLLDKVDLVLTDPPYGINAGNIVFGKASQYDKGDWDLNINQKAVDCLILMSEIAIVWGGNYYEVPPSKCWLVWDKENAGITTFADAELAWTNLDKAVRLKRHLWSGPYQKKKEKRFHPTQKPLDIMKWCIGFAPDADLILDPFLGSGTTAVAAKQLGRQCIGIEMESKYLDIAIERLRQEVLF